MMNSENGCKELDSGKKETQMVTEKKQRNEKEDQGMKRNER